MAPLLRSGPWSGGGKEREGEGSGGGGEREGEGSSGGKEREGEGSGGGLSSLYGATEGLPLTLCTATDARAAAARSARGGGVCLGRACGGVELRVRTAAHLTLPGEQEAGEVLVRGAVVAPGAVGWGWHATGDLGSLDETGCLWLHGRLAHLFMFAAHGRVSPPTARSGSSP